jgi:hypothetical protein
MPAGNTKQHDTNPQTGQRMPYFSQTIFSGQQIISTESGL